MENIFLTTFTTLSIFLSSGMPNTIPAQNPKTEVKTVNKENNAELKVIAQKNKISKPLAVNIDQAKAVQPAIVQPTVPVSGNGPLNDVQIQFLGNCESGMTATRNSGNGYFGAFQFSIGTWNRMGTVYARADLAPLDVQIDAVRCLLSRSSIFTQFPGCARKMQSTGII